MTKLFCLILAKFRENPVTFSDSNDSLAKRGNPKEKIYQELRLISKKDDGIENSVIFLRQLKSSLLNRCSMLLLCLADHIWSGFDRLMSETSQYIR